jgi:hypothetical protein
MRGGRSGGLTSPDPTDRWLFWPAFLLLSALAAWLPLGHRYLPLQDFPEHCALAAIVSHLHDPAYGFADYYRITTWFLPYQTFRLLQIGLGRLLGDAVGFRAALLPYLLGVPLLCLLLCRRLQRDRFAALASFTILVEGNLLWGFLPYVTGVLLWLAGLVLAVDLLRHEGRAAARAAALSLLGVLLFFTHPQVTALWALSLGALALAGLLRRRVSLGRAALLAASAVPGGLLLSFYMLASGWLSGAALQGAVATRTGAVWYSPLTMVTTLPWTTGLALTGPVPALGYLLAVLALTLGALVQRRLDRRPAGPSTYAAWTLFLLLAVLLFALPARFRSEAISGRLPSTLALLLLFLPPLAPPQGRPLLLLPVRLLLVLAALLSLGSMNQTFARYAQSMRPLDKVLELVPMRSRVATLVYDPYPAGIIEMPTDIHLGAHVLAARGGMAAFNFTLVGVDYRPEVPRHLLLLTRQWAPSRTGAVLPDGFQAFYDLVLVRKGPRYPGLPWRRDARVAADRIFDEGGLELWRIKRKETSASPPGSP